MPQHYMLGSLEGSGYPFLMNPGTKILHGVDVSDFSCVAWRWCSDWLEP